MLTPSLDTVRIFLHITAATVWVGGQFVLPAMLPGLRRIEGGTKVAAQAFGRVAWPAFAVLVLTGMWSLATVDVADTSANFQATLFVKILISMITGGAAAAHMVSDSKMVMAVGGAVGFLTSLGAVFLGVMLRTAL